MSGWVRAFSPASVGNAAVGFDILGFTLNGVGDTVAVRRIDAPQVRIRAIHGSAPDLPLDAQHNTAGAALLALQKALALPFGFEIEIDKSIPLGSGMGGSAASCVAALVAANALLEKPLSRQELYSFALIGEAVASGSQHGDNLAPMLLGGLVLASKEHLVPIPVPADWHSVLVHPDAVLETRRARAVLQDHYELGEIIAQNTNLALVLAGCYTNDANLVRAGLNDVLIEPRRAALINGFYPAKHALLECGAMGASISGAGPSLFGWFETREAAQAALPAVQAAFAQAGFSSQAWVSPLNSPAAELIT